jgi:hypothetical protein
VSSPSALVSLEEMQDHLGLEDDEDAEVLQLLLDQVTAMFERLCDRKRAPFSDAIPARSEVHDGTGTDTLFLDYPVASLTSVKIGRDVNAPTETLDVADVDVLVYAAGEREIRRTDGGTFGELDAARCVHVTYATEDDRPDDAKLAVKRVVAQLYGQRGSEDAASETVDGHQRQMADLAATDAVFCAALRTHRRHVFR